MRDLGVPWVGKAAHPAFHGCKKGLSSWDFTWEARRAAEKGTEGKELAHRARSHQPRRSRCSPLAWD